jgi:NhaA family Na+:H+ antiporter
MALRTISLRARRALTQFLQDEAAGGYVLMVAAALALIVANSPLAETYFHALHLKLGPMGVQHWINDGLMALFFLLVGLEIKREVLDGQLSKPADVLLPGAAALGGVILPAAIYLVFNLKHPDSVAGWAIPSATDIAFALGVLALMGPRVPTSLKVFLTAIAIMDDLAAIVIIARSIPSSCTCWPWPARAPCC